jgi:hypothetical protein
MRTGKILRASSKGFSRALDRSAYVKGGGVGCGGTKIISIVQVVQAQCPVIIQEEALVI